MGQLPHCVTPNVVGVNWLCMFLFHKDLTQNYSWQILQLLYLEEHSLLFQTIRNYLFEGLAK